MPVRFREAPDPDSVLTNQKSNKRFKGCYCTTNKPSNFQSLKWEITNTLMSDTTWKPNLCWCFTAWQVRCAYVGKTWTIVKVIYWSWVFLKWFGWYLGWGNWPGEPETPFNVLASFGFFCTKYTEKQLQNRSTKSKA